MRIYGKLLHCPKNCKLFFDNVTLFNKTTEEFVELDFSSADYSRGYSTEFRLKDESIIGESPKGFDFGNNRETADFLKNCVVDTMCISGEGVLRKRPRLRNVYVEVGLSGIFLKVDNLELFEDYTEGE